MELRLRAFRDCAFTLLICAAVFSWRSGVFADEEFQNTYKVTTHGCEEEKKECLTGCNYALGDDEEKAKCVYPSWCKPLVQTNKEFCEDDTKSVKCCKELGYCTGDQNNASFCMGANAFSSQCSSTGVAVGRWVCLKAKTDEDEDGYALEDDPADCDDENADIYPGAYDTNPNCGSPYEWPSPAGDYDCNGVDDDLEKGDVCSESPVVIDLSGDGFRLTNRENGVHFDLDRDGRTERLPWTDPRGDEAWLALDRNGNGRIDNGGELFGNHSDQPRAVDRNGFAALAVFDGVGEGGNEDGWIDDHDRVFSALRIWRDASHNGISEANELVSLVDAGIRRISVRHRETLRVDEFGNWFRFAAPVVRLGSDVGSLAFDVFLDFPPDRLPPGPTARLQRRR